MEDIDLAKFTQEEEAILRLTEEIWNRTIIGGRGYNLDGRN